MFDRTNWYYGDEHPPACTCVACMRQPLDQPSPANREGLDKPSVCEPASFPEEEVNSAQIDQPTIPQEPEKPKVSASATSPHQESDIPSDPDEAPRNPARQVTPRSTSSAGQPAPPTETTKPTLAKRPGVMLALFLLTIMVAFGSLALFLEARTQRLQTSQAEKVAEQQAPVLPSSPNNLGQISSLSAPAPVEALLVTPPETPTRVATPTRRPVTTITPSPTTTPIPTATPEPLIRPDRRYMYLKLLMLEMINSQREIVGAPPVILGDNISAQLHAEQSLLACTSSHWGPDGLKPYMRYTLAGGVQTNNENSTGLSYCVEPSLLYEPLVPDDNALPGLITQAMNGWMESEDHRQNLLDPSHRKVNIGLAWNKYNISANQLFEGDYVEFDLVPNFEQGILRLSGRVKNGPTIHAVEDLSVEIFYDPPPQPLTGGQLSRTYCYDFGTRVTSLRFPLRSNQYWGNDSYQFIAKYCADPYAVPPSAEAPQSIMGAEWDRLFAKGYGGFSELVTVPFVSASVWEVAEGRFEVEADINETLEEYGPGVYTVAIAAPVNGQRAWISEYSIFHEIDPPDTYNPSQWDK